MLHPRIIYAVLKRVSVPRQWVAVPPWRVVPQQAVSALPVRTCTGLQRGTEGLRSTGHGAHTTVSWVTPPADLGAPYIWVVGMGLVTSEAGGRDNTNLVYDLINVM